MLGYSLRRLALIVPTLLCILLVNFLIVQAAPGGPVEQAIARLQGLGATNPGAAPAESVSAGEGGNRGLDPEMVARIERQFGFDKPPAERLWLMLRNYARLDLGDSYFRGASVTALILDKLPVTLSLGLWSLMLTYLVSIPLGIAKAMRNGSAFDAWSSVAIVLGYAIPAFLFALLLVVLFGGGTFLDWFPVRGLVSEDFDQLSTAGKLADYFWHLTLPVTALVVGGFASLTLLTKNSVLDQITRQYVVTARAKGLSERRIMREHVARNAVLLLVAGMPQALVNVLFGGSLLIEVVFSLDGLGRLSYDAAVARDYPVVFGTLFVFTLAGMLIKLFGDLCYRLLDPRIDYAGRAR